MAVPSTASSPLSVAAPSRILEPRLMLATVLNGWARNTHGSLRQALASWLLVCARDRERMMNWLPSRSTSAPPPTATSRAIRTAMSFMS